MIDKMQSGFILPNLHLTPGEVDLIIKHIERYPLDGLFQLFRKTGTFCNSCRRHKPNTILHFFPSEIVYFISVLSFTRLHRTKCYSFRENPTIVRTDFATESTPAHGRPIRRE
jgi:hypothetical protein